MNVITRPLQRHYITVCGIALFVASDYKFRIRDTRDAISGAPDVFVLLELGLYALIALFLLVTSLPPRARRIPIPILTAGLYVAMLAISLTYTPYPTYGAARVVEMTILFALVWRIADRGDRGAMHRFAHAFIVLVGLSVLYGVIYPAPPVSNQQVGRFTWLSVHPAVAGVFVGLAALISLLYLVARSDRPGPMWPMWVYGLILIAVTWGLLETKTRSAVLAAVAGIVVMLISYLRGRGRLILLGGLAMAGATVFLAGADVVVSYFARGESVEQLSTLNARTDLWTAAYRAIRLRPIFGYGTGASQGIFQQTIGLGGGHNSIINVAVDLGAVGLTVWLAMVVALIVGLLRLPATRHGVAYDRALLIGIFVLIEVNGFFYAGPGAVANVAASWTFLSVGWLMVLRRDARRHAGSAVRRGAFGLPGSWSRPGRGGSLRSEGSGQARPSEKELVVLSAATSDGEADLR